MTGMDTCTGCDGPAVEELMNVNEMPAGVEVWFAVCAVYPDCH